MNNDEASLVLCSCEVKPEEVKYLQISKDGYTITFEKQDKEVKQVLGFATGNVKEGK